MNMWAANPIVSKLIEPNAAVKAPSMTWAEMARKEGHRKKHPEIVAPENGHKTGSFSTVIQALEEHGDMMISELAAVTGLKSTVVRNIAARSRGAIERKNEKPKGTQQGTEWAVYGLVEQSK